MTVGSNSCDAARVAAELADTESVERVRHAAFAPASETWLEWSDPGNGKRVGVLLTADGGSKLAVAGHGVFVTDAIAASGLRDYVALLVERCIMYVRTFACWRGRQSSVSTGVGTPVSASRASATSFVENAGR